MNESKAPRRRDAAATAERILRAAQEVFHDKGYEGATTREIADRAGVNLALIKRYYGSKLGLFERAVLPFLTLEAFLDNPVDDLGERLADHYVRTEPMDRFRPDSRVAEIDLQPRCRAAPCRGGGAAGGNAACRGAGRRGRQGARDPDRDPDCRADPPLPGNEAIAPKRGGKAGDSRPAFRLFQGTDARRFDPFRGKEGQMTPPPEPVQPAFESCCALR